MTVKPAEGQKIPCSILLEIILKHKINSGLPKSLQEIWPESISLRHHKILNCAHIWLGKKSDRTPELMVIISQVLCINSKSIKLDLVIFDTLKMHMVNGGVRRTNSNDIFRRPKCDILVQNCDWELNLKHPLQSVQSVLRGRTWVLGVTCGIWPVFQSQSNWFAKSDSGARRPRLLRSK